MKNTCTAPDRHVPKLVCGYPLPCPHHTVLVVVEKTKRKRRGRKNKTQGDV